MIEGVHHIPLKRIENPQGDILHMLRATDPHFDAFGEIYFSWIKPGVIKPWRKHRSQISNIAVPVGNVRCVIYDDREGSNTSGQFQSFDLGESNYALLKIEPGLWHAFTGLAEAPALIANCTSAPHDPDESEKCDLDAIAYEWGV